MFSIIPLSASTRNYASHNVESDEDFDARYESYFNDPDLDGWAIRKGMNDLQVCLEGHGLAPPSQTFIIKLI